MVEKVYIIWCKLNKSTDKFDMGIFTDKKIADETAENYKSIKRIYPKLWVSEYRLSKPIHGGGVNNVCNNNRKTDSKTIQTAMEEF